VNGTNYLVPIGYDISNEDEVRYEAIDTDRVLSKMQSAGSGANVIILDACRNNPLPRATRSSGQGLSRMNAPVGSLILYATAPGAVALDGNGRNGTFTKHLLRSLTAPGIHVGDLALDVRVAVMQDTKNKQVPWSESSLTRRIYLADPEPVSEPSPTAQPQILSGALEESTKPIVDVNGTVSVRVDDEYENTIVSAYRQAAEKGDALAQSRLGYIYDTARYVPEDNQMALYWYQKAAAQGELDAVVNLGVMFRNGDGGATDLAKSFSLFRKAANAGHPVAQYNLGVMYQFGEFVTVGYGEARSWFQKAAVQGNTDAMVSLGDLYSYGLGVETSNSKGYEWYEKAARFGSAAGQSELGFMYDTGSGVEVDYSEAVYWFEKSVAQSYPRAFYNLGEMYELGKGVSKNLDKALELYQQAANRGDQEGVNAISRLKN
jgi:TPR repeat protein